MVVLFSSFNTWNYYQDRWPWGDETGSIQQDDLIFFPPSTLWNMKLLVVEWFRRVGIKKMANGLRRQRLERGRRTREREKDEKGESIVDDDDQDDNESVGTSTERWHRLGQLTKSITRRERGTANDVTRWNPPSHPLFLCSVCVCVCMWHTPMNQYSRI